MFLGCGCLLAMTAAFAPRLVILLAWLFSDRWNWVWDSWIWPFLGFIFLPYTTIMYALAWNIDGSFADGLSGGVSGWGWMWVGLGVILDLMKWGIIGNSRKGVPGYPDSAP